MPTLHGFAAQEVLKNLEIGITLKHKLVFGENIAQVNQFILSKTSQIGFTSKSTLPYIKNNKTGNWLEIPQNLYTPIQQGIVVLKQKNNNLAKSKLFKNFITSKSAQTILKKYGYTPLDN